MRKNINNSRKKQNIQNKIKNKRKQNLRKKAHMMFVLLVDIWLIKSFETELVLELTAETNQYERLDYSNRKKYVI